MNEEENIEFISDFVLSVARVSGNATLEKYEGRYLIDVKKPNSEYCFISTHDGRIDDFLHHGYGGSYMFVVGESTEKPRCSILYSGGNLNRRYLNSLRKTPNSAKYSIGGNDARPYEVLGSFLPAHVNSSMEDRIKDSDLNQQKLGRQLGDYIYNYYHEKSDDFSTIEKEEKQKYSSIIKLISTGIQLSNNVSIQIRDNEYLVSITAKNGKNIVFLVKDEKLGNDEKNVFEIYYTIQKLEEINEENLQENLILLKDQASIEECEKILESTELNHDSKEGSNLTELEEEQKRLQKVFDEAEELESQVDKQIQHKDKNDTENKEEDK